MNIFPSLPFFRILLPFMTGILVSILFGLRWEFGVLFSFPLLAVMLLLDHSKVYSKITFMVLVDLCLFIAGIGLVSVSDLQRQPSYYGPYAGHDGSSQLIAVLNDLPTDKEKTRKLSLSVQAINDSGGWKAVEGKIYVYLRRSVKANELKAGDRVFLNANLQEVNPPMNPFTFDYKTYLYRKQIYHTAFVDSTQWCSINAGTPLNPLLQFGLETKASVLLTLKSSGLTNEAYAICAALLTGYDDDIDRGIIEAFSHSGTLHVLSVSGLHTGLIYLVLNYLLNFIDRKNRFKLSRYLVVTLILWLFALLTGFSAPVLRAVIMFNFLGLGKLYFRGTSRNQLNILLFSAFVLLIYNPWLITDVGFLLSYFAMFGLIYFQPVISEAWKPTHPINKSLWLSISASFSATISTLPITLFVFKQFPFWFFVCNLVVVPATFVLLLLAFLVVIKVTFLVPVINWLIKYLIVFIDLFDSPKWGFLDGIHFTNADFLFMSLLIILAAAAFQRRSYHATFSTLVLILIWQLVSYFESYQAKKASHLTIYQIKNTSVMAVKNRNFACLSELSKKDFDMNAKAHFTSFSYPEIKNIRFNYIHAGDETLICLKKGECLPDRDLGDVTRLLLANGRELSEAEVLACKRLKMVIVDGSSAKSKVKSTEQLCRKFDIGFYNTTVSGALVLPLEQVQ